MEWDGMEATKQGRQPKLNKKGRIQPLLGLDKTSANIGKKKRHTPLSPLGSTHL